MRIHLHEILDENTPTFSDLNPRTEISTPQKRRRTVAVLREAAARAFQQLDLGLSVSASSDVRLFSTCKILKYGKVAEAVQTLYGRQSVDFLAS